MVAPSRGKTTPKGSAPIGHACMYWNNTRLAASKTSWLLIWSKRKTGAAVGAAPAIWNEGVGVAKVIGLTGSRIEPV